MASAIDEIMASIEAWTPTYDSDVTVAVQAYDAIDSISDATKMPVRQILAPDNKFTSHTAFVALGRTTSITWNILDRCFLQPISLQKGLETWNDKIYLYIASYYEQVRTNRSTSNQSHVVDVNVRAPYALEWPGAGANQYYVVDCVVQVEEFLGG